MSPPLYQLSYSAKAANLEVSKLESKQKGAHFYFSVEKEGGKWTLSPKQRVILIHFTLYFFFKYYVH